MQRTAHTLVISCVGRQVALVEQFRAALGVEGRVVAVDADPLSAGAAAADAAHVAPQIDSVDYPAWMLAVCEREHADMLITLLPEDLRVLETVRDQLERAGVVLVGMPPEALEITLDKRRLAQLCEGTAVQALPTWELKAIESIPDDAYPLIAKEAAGKGSRGQVQVATAKQALELRSQLSAEGRACDYILQQWAQGQEYGIDVVNDLSGTYVTTFVRKKLRMRNGETDIARTVADERMEHFGEALGRKLSHQGLVDCDLMRCADGDYLLDVNARFGGGYPFSHAAGANVPAALVAWLRGEVPEAAWLEPRPGIAHARADTLQPLYGVGESLAIITTAGHDIGMGHASRQIAVAKSAQQTGNEPVILTDSDIVALRALEERLPCVVLDIEDAARVGEQLETIAPSCVIVDVHERDFPAYRWIAQKWRTLLAVSRVGHDFAPYGSEMVLMGEGLDEWCTQSVTGSRGNLTRVHAGRAFVVFREEFESLALRPDEPRGHEILIAHGGADPYALTQRCLTALEGCAGVYPVRVLVGPAFSDAQEIKRLAAASKHDCEVIEGATSVAEFMQSGAIAIINGGNVRYELCLTGTPFIALSFQQRQYECTEQLSRMGVGVNLGVAGAVDDERIAGAVDQLMEDDRARERMSATMRSLFDTQGAHRIVAIALGKAAGGHDGPR